MYRKIVFLLLVLLSISTVSANNNIEITNNPSETITIGEVGGSETVEFTVTESPDVSDGLGSIELVLATESGTNLVRPSNYEYKNIEGGRSYEVTFNSLQGNYLSEVFCGTNKMIMFFDDSSHNDYTDGEYTKDELFDGENGIDGNLDDGQTDSFGTLTVRGEECVPDNQAPSANFEYIQDESDIGVSTKVYLDASASSDPDGEIVDYRWEADGGIDFNSGSAAWMKWSAPGTKSISLTVEDDDGATHTYHKTLEVQETNYETDSAGRYMYWVMNPNDPSNYYYWYLSNVRWGVDNLNPEEPGSLVLQDFDEDSWYDKNQDETAVYRGEVGQIVGDLGVSNQNTLEPLSRDHKSDPQKQAGDQKYDWCSEENGQDTSCHILEYEFEAFPDEGTYQGTGDIDMPSVLDNADDKASIGFDPGLDTTHMNTPHGQIALAHAPNVFDDKDMNGQVMFAVCKGDQYGSTVPDSDGVVIDMAPKTFNSDVSVDQEADLYRCDSQWGNSEGWRGDEGGVWRPVSECNDGLDNDGDGNIDHPNANVASASSDNSGCTSLEDNSESDEVACTPAFRFDGANYVAYYGGSSDSNGFCDGSNGNTQTFDEWINDIPGSNGQVPSAQIFTCDQGAAIGYCSDRSFDSHDENTSKSGSQIYYAKYYPTKTYLLKMLEFTTYYSIVSEKSTSHFVNSEGWTPARMSLDGSEFSSEGLKPNNRKGAERIYGPDSPSVGRHSGSYWFDTLGLVDGDGNGYSSGSYNDSWVVANAGAPNNDRISDEFPGGWAGKCAEGQTWKFVSREGQWACSGAIQNWDQAVLVPDVKDGSGDETVGIVIMPYNFVEDASTSIEIETDSDPVLFEQRLSNIEDDTGLDLSDVLSYREAVVRESSDFDSVSDAPTLNSISVSCYPDTNPDGGFEETKDIPIESMDTDPKPVAVTGQIDLSDSESYTCNWNYTSSDFSRNPVNNAGTPVDLSDAGEKNDVLLEFFKEDRGFTDLMSKSYSSSEFEDMISDWY